ncbi:MAG: ribonuclease PH [Candidatus Cloacimonadales bacterium]|nr:ribonuclease PH [Candidatus Cloacimonadales bacterium]
MKKRKTKITRDYLMHPAGSVLIETGNTKVICTVMIEESIPSFLKNVDPPQGWLTAEYSMLPGAPNQRFKRERGKTNSRSTEIQRLIGRSLRAVVDMTKFPGISINVDCDVLQADGGTRTAAITGACVALCDAFGKLQKDGLIKENPLNEMIAAISVGIVNGQPVLDLDYEADSRADVDMNVVMTESGKFVEIQGTAEAAPFSDEELKIMLKAAKIGIKQLIKEQKKALEKK